MDKKKKFIVNIVYFTFSAILIYFAITVASSYLLPFLIGIIIAYFVQKPANYFSVKIGIKKQKCAAVLSVAIFLFIIFLFFLISWFLVSQFSELMKFLSSNSQQFISFFESVYTKFENVLEKINLDDSFKKIFKDAINSFALKITSFLSNTVTAIIKKTPSVLLSSVVTIVATCYIAKDYDKLLKFVKGFVKKEYVCTIIEIKNIFTECFLKLSIGYFWLFLITFAELSFGFFIFGFDDFLLIALIVAFLDLLPIIGTGTVLIPWSIIEYLRNEYFIGTGLVLLYLVITIFRNIIEPKIIGKQIDINPLFTLIFIFIGFRLGGIVGMLVIPIIIIVIFTYFRRKILEDND